jgi:gliding motility-associated lipoprotein GldD
LVKLIFIFLFATLFLGCEKEYFPKPKAYLYHEYPLADYHRFINGCPYSFAVSKQSEISFEPKCDAEITYPTLKAKVHITYRPVQDNLTLILQEADKLTSKHTVRADAIIPHAFQKPEHRVYGMLNEVKGESASNVQFYVTDSVHHVLTAALYFETKPNYDSLYPAVDYIKNDMMQMMETIRWKN